MNTVFQKCQLGDVINLKRGYDLPKQKRVHGSVPILSSSGITDYHNKAKVEGPGVVTGRYGTLGEIFYVTEAYWPLNTSLYVQDFKGNDPRFISYFLGTLHLGSQNSAGAVPGLNRNHLHQLQVNLPDLPTQKKIAGILSAYDDLIENNLRRIAILEEMAQSLYREWFVHFRFPGHETVQLVDSALGKIPEGWEVGRLDDALVLQRGFDLPKRLRKVGAVPIYAASGITAMHSESKVKAPGVVTGRSGTLGRVMYIQEDFWPLNTALWVKEFRKATPLYAFYLLKSLDLAQFNSGAAVPTLNRNDVHGLPIVLPDADVLEKFERLASDLHSSKDVLQKKNENLRKTRDLLLPKLLSS